MSEKYNGLTKQAKLNRHWIVCPRCHQETINKDLRQCTTCKGRVYWRGDSYNKSIEIMEGFYVWDQPITTGILGWYAQSYYGITYGNHTKK